MSTLTMSQAHDLMTSYRPVRSADMSVMCRCYHASLYIKPVSSDAVKWLNMCVCIQRKPRVVPNPVPTSPTSSTPEPDTSTVPLDNATIPNSALQAPTGTRHPEPCTYCKLLLIIPFWDGCVNMCKTNC